MRCIIFDTETTGLLKPSMVPLNTQPHIIEFASMIVNTKTLKVERTFTTLCKPPCPLDPVITKITKLTDEDLADAPLFSQQAASIAQEFKRADVGIAHNMPFDSGMLLNELRRCEHMGFPWPQKLICTVQAYEHVHGYRMNMEKFYAWALGEPLVQTHRALDDVKALHKILLKLEFYKKGVML